MFLYQKSKKKKHQKISLETLCQIKVEIAHIQLLQQKKGFNAEFAEYNFKRNYSVVSFEIPGLFRFWEHNIANARIRVKGEIVYSPNHPVELPRIYVLPILPHPLVNSKTGEVILF
jgi:hypothetical protein